VLAADGLDEAVLERIGAELGQGPAAVGQADRRRRLVGEPAEGSLLVRGDPGRRPAPVAVAHPVQPPAVEGVQIGVDSVGMEGEEAADRGGVPAFGVEHDRFGSALLPDVGGGWQELAQLTEFRSGRPPRGHGAGHGWTSGSAGEPTIVPRVM
jgi:hypothetical protein